MAGMFDDIMDDNIQIEKPKVVAGGGYLQSDYDEFQDIMDAEVVQEQLEAIGEQGGQASAPEREVPFRFRDTGDNSFGENLIESGQHNVQGMMEMTRHPIEAVKQLTELLSAEGGQAIWGYLKESYGSPKKAWQSIQKDPMGVLSELSLAGGPVKTLGKTKGMPKTEMAGAVIENLDMGTGMSTLGKGAGVNLLDNLDNTNPEKIYENLLKMPVTPRSKYRQRATREGVIDTLLENRISPTGKGVDKLQEVIDTKSRQLDDIIDKAELDGVDIPAEQVYANVLDLRQQIIDQRGNPERTAELRAINKWMKDWKQSMGSKQFFSPNELRELRQAQDSRVNWNSIPAQEPPMTTKLRKDSAHGMRNALGNAVPEGQKVTKEISTLLDASEPLERATARLGNNNGLPLNKVIQSSIGGGVAATGAAEGNVLQTVLGLVMSGAARSWTPKTRAKVAQMIYHNRGLSAPVKRNAIRKLGSQAAQTNLQMGEYQDYMAPQEPQQ